MRIIAAILLMISLASCDKRQTVYGTIQSVDEVNFPVTIQVLYNVDDGYIYVLKDTANNIHLFQVKQKNLLPVGSTGSFVLGKNLWSGRSEIFERGKKVQKLMVVHDLEEYSLSK